ncbi:MAG: hypothetical protein JW861_13690 [Bacteroidales bacterium]|nr:hypothetical protein [Bacteroidales bacterium]
MKTAVPFLLILVMIAWSCTGRRNSPENNRINSLRAEIGNIRQTLHSLDPDLLTETSLNIHNTIQKIREIQGEISDSAMNAIIVYLAIRRPLSRYLRDMERNELLLQRLADSLDVTARQFSKGRIDFAGFQQKISADSSTLVQLGAGIRENVHEVIKQLRKYDSLTPQIQQILK